MTSFLPGVQLYIEDSSGGLIPVTEAILQGNGSVTPIDLSGATTTQYDSLALLLAATPLTDELGIVAPDATDGNAGKVYAWDLATTSWTIITSVSSVNGQTGVVTLRTDDIEETGTRVFVTPEQRALITSTSSSIGTLTAKDTSQDARMAAIEAVNVSQGDDIATLQNTVAVQGDVDVAQAARLVTAEAEIDAIQATNVTQTGQINNLLSTEAAQNTRLTNIEAVDLTQGSAITTLQTGQATQDARLATIEAGQTTQDATDAALAAQISTAETAIGALENGQAVQDAAHAALAIRVTTAEGNIITLQGQQSAINAVLSSLPTTYQVRSEKNQPGGYVDPLFLPASAQVIRDITPTGTIAERDALAANDPRPEVNGPWGPNQIGYSVFVTDTGAGEAGWFIWNGTTFLDFTSSISILSTTDVPEGINLYYTDARAANAPAVVTNTADIAAIKVEQTTQNGQIDALDTEQTNQSARLATIEAEQVTQTGNITTNQGNIATNTAAIAANVGDINALGTAVAANDVELATLAGQQSAQDAAIAARLTSFNGRTGPAIVPVSGDYTSTLIPDLSGLTVGSVTDALLNLDGRITSGLDNTNKVTKGGDTDGVPLVIGTNDTQPLTLETNNAPRIVVAADGLVTINGLTESAAATSSLRVNPATNALHVYPDPIIALGHIEGCEVSVVSNTTITVAAGQMEIGGRLVSVSSAITKSTNGAWAAGTGNGGQIGTWNNGSQYVYVGHNPTTEAVDVFVSNSIAETVSNGFTLKLLCPLYVESSAIWSGWHNSKARRFVYKNDWILSDWIVTTADAGAFYAVGVPIYPGLWFSTYLQAGLSNSHNTLAVKITNESESLSGTFNTTRYSSPGTSKTASSYYRSSDDTYFITPWDGRVQNSNAQVKAKRIGNYNSSAQYSSLTIGDYQW